MDKRVIVVDGSNVAYVEKSDDGKPRVANLTAVRRALVEKGFDPIIIVDASLRHFVDDPEQLEGLLKKQEVLQAPAETDADYFVIETAENHESKIVSNDQYDPYREKYPWIEKRRIPLMIVRGEVEFYKM